LLGRVGWGEFKSSCFEVSVVLISLTQPSPAERANEIDGFHEIFKIRILQCNQKPSLVGEGWVGRI